MEKTKVLSVRLAVDEINELDNLVELINQDASENLRTNRNEFLRMIIRQKTEGVPAFLKTELAEIKEANRNLLAIGRNLNQIVKRINSDETGPEHIAEEHLRHLTAFIVKSRNEIKALVAEIEKR